MSDGKGADDLHVFDELLKSKSSDQAVDPNSSAAWRGGTLPPPPIGLAGGLMAPVGRVTGHPPTSPALSQVPPPPPGRTSSTAPPMTSLTSMRPAPAPVSRVPPPPPRSASGFTEAPPIDITGAQQRRWMGQRWHLVPGGCFERQPIHVASCGDRTRGPFEFASRGAGRDGPVAVLAPPAADLA